MIFLIAAAGVLLFSQRALHAESGPQSSTAFRLYDSVVCLFEVGESEAEVRVDLDVRDLNYASRGPSEMLVRIYDPEGKAVVRQVIPDDGVNARAAGPWFSGWDHEAWYYATCYSRGLEPGVRFSALTEPGRVAQMPARRFSYDIKQAKPGVYRMVLAGTSDLIVTVASNQPRALGVMGSPDWLVGRGDQFEKSYFFIPKGTVGVTLRMLEMEQPFGRGARVLDAQGNVVCAITPGQMLSEVSFKFAKAGAFDDQLFKLEVDSGEHDYLIEVRLDQPKKARNWRGQPGVFAALCPDAGTARALKGGAIYHDGRVFWQGYQVRLYDWLKTLTNEQKTLPAGLATAGEPFVSVGSHETPGPQSADRILHDYPAHKDARALNAALTDMLEGMMLMGPADHVMHGRNLAYEMGTYSFFYHRPAWLLLRKYPAPGLAAEAIGEFALQVGDRLAFCRGIELVNGNSLASLIQGLRYCVEATQDPLLASLYETYWDRFRNRGFGDRFGVGPSGGVQESFGYDHHYGGYILRGWRAGMKDLNEPRFKEVYDGVLELYSYTWSPDGVFAPWSSRTKNKPPGAAYEGVPAWKGYGTGDVTGSIRDANEWVFARRANYYTVAYFGRIDPTWLGEGFHGQIGFGGGTLCQVYVPDKGTVIGSSLNGDYGRGMHLSQWPGFHIHSLVGTTTDGKPFVAANSQPVVRWEKPNTVIASGEVRESSVRYERSYTFGPDGIACKVALNRSGVESVFDIYGGANNLRGALRECHEMIPYVAAVQAKGKPEVQVVFLMPGNGEKATAATRQAQTTRTILLKRAGFGAVITLDQPRPVKLGENQTLLIELCTQDTPAEKIAISYMIQPFSGDAPSYKDADAAGLDAAAESDAATGGVLGK